MLIEGGDCVDGVGLYCVWVCGVDGWWCAVGLVFVFVGLLVLMVVFMV